MRPHGILLASLAVAASCGPSATPDDAGRDAGSDAAISSDVGVDAAPTDAGSDGGDDAGTDGGARDSGDVDTGALDADGFASLRLTPTTRNFGVVFLGGGGCGLASSPVDFTLANTGTAATGSISVVSSGPSVGDFRVTADHCTGTTLDPGASCIVTVVAMPVSAPGALVASLDAAASPGGMVSSMLTGTAVVAESIPFITPSAHDFGSVSVGTSGAATPFTVTNSGGCAIGPMTVHTAGTSPADFVLETDACSGAMLPPGGSCSVGVRFAPSASGARDATLVANGAGAGAQGSAALQGTGSP